MLRNLLDAYPLCRGFEHAHDGDGLLKLHAGRELRLHLQQIVLEGKRASRGEAREP